MLSLLSGIPGAPFAGLVRARLTAVNARNSPSSGRCHAQRDMPGLWPGRNSLLLATLCFNVRESNSLLYASP